jgi:plastocyanin
MNKDFRTRVLLPLLLPLLALAAIIGFAFSLSRVLLAVSEAGSNMIALFVALYVLLVAAVVATRPRISSKALGIGLVLGLLAVGVSGGLGAAAGMRPLHEEEEHAEGESVASGEGEVAEGVTEVPEGAFAWVAVDIDFAEAPDVVPSGEQTIAIVNEGAIVHNVVFEGTNVKVEAQGGATEVEEFDLEPGTYTYFCDVPGHRAAGMVGTISVQ